MPTLSWEKVRELADNISQKIRGKKLNDIEIKVLKAAYEGKKYSEIEIGSATDAEQVNAETGNFYTEDYCKRIGKHIWDMLSKELGVKVSKSNLVEPLWHYKQKQDKEKQASSQEATPTSIKEGKNLEPSDVPRAPLDPYFYIERHNVESSCYKAIEQPGGILRITSAQGMGKTSLLGKVFEYAEQQDYKTAKLDLNLATKKTLTDLNSFLYWFCAQLSNNLAEVFASLELQSKIEECWQNPSEPKDNCNEYLKYLLSNSECPIVIGIDNTDQLIKFPNELDTYEEFFPLLRSWHDSSKQRDKVGITWRKLRVILVCSTQVYPQLPLIKSPFNVGRAVKLPDFEAPEVATFAKHYELDEQLGEDGLSQLMGLVGGHPDLLNQALRSLKHQETTLEQLLTLAPTEDGIYKNHLLDILSILKDNPQLKSAYKEVLIANQPVRLDTEVAFKLHSIGLVKFSGNNCKPRYDLHRQYFSERLE